jgi:RHS repeat-associated protein
VRKVFGESAASAGSIKPRGNGIAECWGDYSGDCRRLDADSDRDIDAVDYSAISSFLDELSGDQEIQRTPAPTHSQLGNPFAHQGLVFDPEIGSYQNRHRQYNPKLKRFMQRDPLVLRARAKSRYQDGLNVYTYVRGNPVIHVDPPGTVTWWPRCCPLVFDICMHDNPTGGSEGTEQCEADRCACEKKTAKTKPCHAGGWIDPYCHMIAGATGSGPGFDCDDKHLDEVGDFPYWVFTWCVTYADQVDVTEVFLFCTSASCEESCESYCEDYTEGGDSDDAEQCRRGCDLAC